jgi:predicted phosphodiesterase
VTSKQVEEVVRGEANKLLRKHTSTWQIIDEGLNRLLGKGEPRLTLEDARYLPKERLWALHGHQLKQLVRRKMWAVRPAKAEVVTLGHFHLQFVTRRRGVWIVFTGHWKMPYFPRFYQGLIPHVGAVRIVRSGKMLRFESQRGSDRLRHEPTSDSG